MPSFLNPIYFDQDRVRLSDLRKDYSERVPAMESRDHYEQELRHALSSGSLKVFKGKQELEPMGVEDAITAMRAKQGFLSWLIDYFKDMFSSKSASRIEAIFQSRQPISELLVQKISIAEGVDPSANSNVKVVPVDHVQVVRENLASTSLKLALANPERALRLLNTYSSSDSVDAISQILKEHNENSAFKQAIIERLMDPNKAGRVNENIRAAILKFPEGEIAKDLISAAESSKAKTEFDSRDRASSDSGQSTSSDPKELAERHYESGSLGERRSPSPAAGNPSEGSEEGNKLD